MEEGKGEAAAGHISRPVSLTCYNGIRHSLARSAFLHSDSRSASRELKALQLAAPTCLAMPLLT